MKLIKIEGKIYDLTILWNPVYESRLSLDEQNLRAIKGNDIVTYGIGRLLRPGVVKSKATAIIEIKVNDFPRQELYEIYYTKKGFYCNVQGNRVYLKDIINNDN